MVQAGYNLLYGCWKYSWDADCELFLKILRGEVKEDVYVEQIQLQVLLVPLPCNTIVQSIYCLRKLGTQCACVQSMKLSCTYVDSSIRQCMSRGRVDRNTIACTADTTRHCSQSEVVAGMRVLHFAIIFRTILALKVRYKQVPLCRITTILGQNAF